MGVLAEKDVCSCQNYSDRDAIGGNPGGFSEYSRVSIWPVDRFIRQISDRFKFVGFYFLHREKIFVYEVD
jgi:hypothetical protein